MLYRLDSRIVEFFMFLKSFFEIVDFSFFKFLMILFWVVMCLLSKFNN